MTAGPNQESVVWYRAPRLTLPIPGVRDFQKRYEAAVPELPVSAVSELVARGAPWSEMVELIACSATTRGQ